MDDRISDNVSPGQGGAIDKPPVLGSALSSGQKASWLDDDEDEDGPYDPRCMDCMASIAPGTDFCARCLLFNGQGY